MHASKVTAVMAVRMVPVHNEMIAFALSHSFDASFGVFFEDHQVARTTFEPTAHEHTLPGMERGFHAVALNLVDAKRKAHDYFLVSRKISANSLTISLSLVASSLETERLTTEHCLVSFHTFS